MNFIFPFWYIPSQILKWIVLIQIYFYYFCFQKNLFIILSFLVLGNFPPAKKIFFLGGNVLEETSW